MRVLSLNTITDICYYFYFLGIFFACLVLGIKSVPLNVLETNSAGLIPP